jgi:hypothetical protein
VGLLAINLVKWWPDISSTRKSKVFGVFPQRAIHVNKFSTILSRSSTSFLPYCQEAVQVVYHIDKKQYKFSIISSRSSTSFLSYCQEAVQVVYYIVEKQYKFSTICQEAVHTSFLLEVQEVVGNYSCHVVDGKFGKMEA